MQPTPPDKKTQGDNAAQERAKSMIGQTISDRYRIRELIAMGGMGAVYRGDHLLLKKRIAIKLLHPETENLPELVKRFEREAIAGAHVQHPNVATATDFGKLPDGSYFLILEYVKGITLHEVIEKGALTVRRAAMFTKQIASALHALHAKGIYHRDIKPRNIMVVDGPPEVIKIIDLGLAKLKIGDFNEEQAQTDHSMSDEDDATALTVAGTIFGTLAYLAPEAAEGMDSVDGRSDLYALGLIMYEMLCGKRPFVALNPVELFMQHRVAPVPPMSTRAPGIVVPAAFEGIAKKLLEKQPAKRFQTGQEVVEAIDAALAALGENEGDEVVNTDKSGRAGEQRDSTPTPPTVMQKSETLNAAPTEVKKAAALKTPVPAPKSQPAAKPSAAAKAAPTAEAPSTITTPAAVQDQDKPAPPPLVPAKKKTSALQSNVVTVVAGVALGCIVMLGIKLYQKQQASTAPVKPTPAVTQQAAVKQDKPAPTVPPPPPPAATTADVVPAATVSAAPAPAPTPAEPAAANPPTTSTATPEEIATIKSRYQIAWRGKDWRGAGREAIALAKASPEAFNDTDLAQRTEKLAILLSKENAETDLLEVLANGLGSKGLDILYALVEGQGRAPIALAAAKLLQDEKRLEKATPAMRIALDFRNASCAERLKLLERATKEGDSRTRLVLETGGRDCFPNNSEIEKVIFDLRTRFPKRFNYE